MLATAGDDGNVLLWVPAESSMKPLGEDHAEDKETWRTKHSCRTSSGAEIYDLAWSPDGVYFITGGVDNTARIYNAHTGMHVVMYNPFYAKRNRCHDQADRRAQPLCAGRCLGSSERVCRNPILRSLGTYLHSQTQGWHMHIVNTWKVQQNGSAG